MRYAFVLAYDGTNYCGWQVQDNAVSVQQRVEEAIFSRFGIRARVKASGRTDAGVHARGQVCQVDLELDMDGSRFADALNTALPCDIAALKSCVAPDGFDVNSSAKKKTYEYSLYFGERRNPLLDRYACFVKGKPDLDGLNRAARYFVGEHDFAAYRASGSSAKTTVRSIYSASFERRGELVTFSVTGNGFLYNMVRTLTGTALGYSQGRLSDGDLQNSIINADRGSVGKTMPPNGLCLMEVDYGIKLFN